MELISRMMDGSIPYDAEGRLEPVSAGPGAKQDDKIERLKEVPLFEGCSQRQLRSVAKIARVFDVGANTVLTRAGEPGDEFFLIIDGAARVEVSAEKQVPPTPWGVLRRDELAGWGPAVCDGRRGYAGAVARHQPPALLRTSQGSSWAHSNPVDHSVDTRSTGRGAGGTSQGPRDGVMSGHPVRATEQDSAGRAHLRRVRGALTRPASACSGSSRRNGRS